MGPSRWDRRLRIAVGAARGLRFLHAQRPQGTVGCCILQITV